MPFQTQPSYQIDTKMFMISLIYDKVYNTSILFCISIFDATLNTNKDSQIPYFSNPKDTPGNGHKYQL